MILYIALYFLPQANGIKFCFAVILTISQSQNATQQLYIIVRLGISRSVRLYERIHSRQAHCGVYLLNGLFALQFPLSTYITILVVVRQQ